MTSWTAADLPSFAGRTVIVTGANSGLGAVTARELARVGAQVILAVRNTGKGEAAAREMTGDVEVRRLDLQDLASVRQFADGVDTVDVLINNAGVMAVPHSVTADGFETQIGTNHLGHFALANLLLPKLTDRVVTVTWALTGALCGIAGTVFAINNGSFGATSADLFLVVILAAVFLGGPGQAYGAMAGALIIGLATEISAAYINPSYKDVVAFVVLLVVMVARPGGVLGAAA